MREEMVLGILNDIEGSLIDLEMKSPRISIIEMDNLRSYITRIKKEILSHVFEDQPKIS
jgi:hypothetical protein